MLFCSLYGFPNCQMLYILFKCHFNHLDCLKSQCSCVPPSLRHNLPCWRACDHRVWLSQVQSHHRQERETVRPETRDGYGQMVTSFPSGSRDLELGIQIIACSVKRFSHSFYFRPYVLNLLMVSVKVDSQVTIKKRQVVKLRITVDRVLMPWTKWIWS